MINTKLYNLLWKATITDSDNVEDVVAAGRFEVGAREFQLCSCLLGRRWRDPDRGQGCRRTAGRTHYYALVWGSIDPDYVDCKISSNN